MVNNLAFINIAKLLTLQQAEIALHGHTKMKEASDILVVADVDRD